MMSRWGLIKADIDRYVSNPDYKHIWFPKRSSNFAYVLKLLILLKRGGCFRVIFYYRAGRIVGGVLKRILKPPYGRTTVIDCPNVAGGVFFSLTHGVLC